MYLGLELAGADVRYCEASPAELHGGATIDVKRLELGPLTPVLAEAERSLRVLGPPLQTGVLRDAEYQLASGQWKWTQQYAEILAPLRSTRSNPRAMGIAVPYATPPSICRGLSKLIPERSGGTAGAAATQPHIYALEAPFAVALDLLATGRVELPATIVLITPGFGGSEVTGLELAAEGTNLRLEVRGFAEIPAGASLGSGWLTEQVAAVFRSVGESPRCFVAEEALATLPPEFAALGGSAFAGRSAVAGDALVLGATRFAALREGDLSGLNHRGIAIHRLAPRTVGLIGVNHPGEGVWRSLFPAGRPYEEPQPPLAASAAAGGMLMLAEIAAPQEPPPLWLWHNEWPTWRLIVYTARHVPRAPVTGHLLQIKRDKPQGRSIWQPAGGEFSARWVT